MNATTRQPSPQRGDALVMIDVQEDFLPGGALAVPGGGEIIDPARRAIARFRAHHLPIVATRDWHPADHCSFNTRGGPWPPHCVQHTRGADFDPGLNLPGDVLVVSKGDTADVDSYSDFAGTALADMLRNRGVTRLFVGGLATDYCVQATVLDARKLGFEVVVLDDTIRAIDAKPGDGQRARERMRAAGVEFARTTDLQ